MKNSIVVIGGGESGVGAAYLASKKGYNVFLEMRYNKNLTQTFKSINEKN